MTEEEKLVRLQVVKHLLSVQQSVLSHYETIGDGLLDLRGFDNMLLFVILCTRETKKQIERSEGWIASLGVGEAEPMVRPEPIRVSGNEITTALNERAELYDLDGEKFPDDY